jgi:hypothetical protein
MMRVREPEDLTSVFEEMRGQNDRAAILVGGAMLEYALEKVIERRLRKPRNKTEANAIFNDWGIVGTFSGKIWAAYFLKVIGPTVRSDADLIHKIRNEAAHHPSGVSFEHTASIADRCRELKMVDTGDCSVGIDLTVMRSRFVVTCQFLVSNLLMRAGDEKAEMTAAFEQLAPTLDK